MKRYIRSSIYKEFDGWSQEDIDLWEQIDWKARNYEAYPVESDSFRGHIVLYGVFDNPVYIPCKFQKYIRSNPIYAPYYGPVDPYFALQDYIDDGYKIIDPMYDGRKHNGYQIHDRCETQELYDSLSN